MKQLHGRQEWLRRMTLPLFVLGIFSITWIGAVNVATYRSLGVRVTYVDLTSMTLLEEISRRMPIGVLIVVFLGVIIPPVAFLLRLHFRWWVMLASITIVGSPVAIFGGRAYTMYLWRLNRGGTPWEDVVPASVGLAVACVLGLVADTLLDRRQRAIRRRRTADVLCPSCGYDLRGTITAGSKRCSECGVSFEPVRIETGGIDHKGVDLAGVAAVPPRGSAKGPS